MRSGCLVMFVRCVGVFLIFGVHRAVIKPAEVDNAMVRYDAR